MNLQYTVLENGLDFILTAINDLSIANEDTTDEIAQKSLIKYTLLNLSSGIELVLKYRLLQEHWTYVFADMNKARKNALQAGEFKSVDSETIIERLENLCDIKLEESDKLDLKNLRKRRNKAEHFEFDEHILSVQSSIHKSISILIKIMVDYYNFDEFSDEEAQLFADIKETMRTLEKHYNDAKAIAQKTLEQTGNSVNAITCPECEEKFLLIDDGVKCYFCEYEDSGESAAQNYIQNIIGIDEYSTVKDGGDYPLEECPECGAESFVYDCEGEKAICFDCGYLCNKDDLSACSCCGVLFHENTEDGVGICSSCLDYKTNKDR